MVWLSLIELHRDVDTISICIDIDMYTIVFKNAEYPTSLLTMQPKLMLVS